MNFAGNMQKIAVFRALQLGDMLCVIPAIRALRTVFPDAHITLLGLPWEESFVNRFPGYFDAFIHFPGYPGLPEQESRPDLFPTFIKAMQQLRFDLVLQMQGNGSIVNPMVSLMDARYTAGFWRREDYCPDPALFLEYPDHGAEIDRHLLLMQHLGIPSQGRELEFPITADDKDAYDDLQLPLIPGEYICVHPGSRGSHRQWPPKLFAKLADHFASQGWQIVLTGTKEEIPLTTEVADHMYYTSINTAGMTTLGSLAVLINQARALFSNCTGVSHIAAALGTPSIVISMDGEPERWGPLNKQLHDTIDWTKEQRYDHVLRRSKRLIDQTVRQPMLL
jgi:ADP-heptose:LPS heptosyltransferase